ncbi:MAG: glycosyltransferase family 2 protein, partial [Pirellulales bacterium]
DLGPVVKEVIVVDDGSTDETAQIARRLARHCPLIQVHELPRNQGKTAAIRHALAQATGDIVIIQDADLEYDPSEIPEVIRPILRGEADVVYGSRFMVRRAARVLYFYHYLANKLLTFVSNVLTNRNMSDIETCYKVFRAGVIKPLALSSKGFGLEVEITAMVCHTSARTYEVPISYYGRTYAEGKKIGLRDGLAALGYILYYNLIAPRLRSGRSYRAAVEKYLTDLRTTTITPQIVVPRPMVTPLGDWPTVAETPLYSEVP